MVTNPKKSKSKNLPADAMTVKKYCTFSLHFHIIFWSCSTLYVRICSLYSTISLWWYWLFISFPERRKKRRSHVSLDSKGGLTEQMSCFCGVHEIMKPLAPLSETCTLAKNDKYKSTNLFGKRKISPLIVFRALKITFCIKKTFVIVYLKLNRLSIRWVYI